MGANFHPSSIQQDYFLRCRGPAAQVLPTGVGGEAQKSSCLDITVATTSLLSPLIFRVSNASPPNRPLPPNVTMLSISYVLGSDWHSQELVVKLKVAQLCPTLGDLMDYTVHGILQARILEWVAALFSRGSSQPRVRTQVSHIAGGFFTVGATR